MVSVVAWPEQVGIPGLESIDALWVSTTQSELTTYTYIIE
jgi:hypothetical protein